MTLLVAGAGTGGTITGLARAIRDSEAHIYPSDSDCSNLSNGKSNGLYASRALILAVDPVGSILGGGEPGNYEVEGIGYVCIHHSSHASITDLEKDFFPDVLDREPQLVDEWLKTTDDESFEATKRLM